MGFQGNGNGIKLGGNSSVGIHEAWNCITFNNKDHGFDENHNKGGVKLYNCLAFDCGTYDYFFEECNNASNFQFFNNISLGRVDLECGASNYTASNNVCANASDSKMGWGANVVSGYSKDDFVSLTEEDAKAPRAVDGSMPTRFARLKSTSVFIDKGVDKSLPADVIAEFPFLEQPIYGNGRDLGPYEYRPLCRRVPSSSLPTARPCRWRWLTATSSSRFLPTARLLLTSILHKERRWQRLPTCW